MTEMILLREGSAGRRCSLYSVMPRATQTLADNQIMFFPSGSDVAEWFFQSGMAEKSLIAWVFDSLISPEFCFLDVGAHVGTYTWTCGKKAKHTYSFECSPRSFCYLAANVALHDLTESVTLFNYALGATDGSVKYVHRSVDGGGSGIAVLSATDATLPQTEVQVRRLDSLNVDGEIGFIKLDVEGAERDFFLGGVETLRRNNWPPVLFESWGPWKTDAPAAELRSALFATVTDLGYKIVQVQDDMFLAASDATLARLQMP